jgi:Transposase DNA-binding/Transposase DDE domain
MPQQAERILGEDHPDSSLNMETPEWIEQEIAGCSFPDQRLRQRLQQLLQQLSSGLGESIPFACQDWAHTKAAYRFLSNPRVNEGAILAGHFQSTRSRLAVTDSPILILHDTTEFTFARNDRAPVGLLHKSFRRKGKKGRPLHSVVCGILMHSSLAVTPDGLPLGLAAIKFWNRKKFKGTNALKRKVNPTRVPIEEKESFRWLENVRQATALFSESQRCVHIGDRESDIYEWFCTAQQAGTHFLLRTCVDRLAQDGKCTVSAVMKQVRVKGLHRICVKDRKGNWSEAVLAIKYRRLRVLPPVAKQKQYPPLILTVIYAQEQTVPEGRDRIDWKLITNLPVSSRREALEKLTWYACRWKIETFHKILKSGCQAEQARLRTADRLANLISVFCILSWRIFWMTMSNRVTPEASPLLALTPLEVDLLDRLIKDKGGATPLGNSLSAYLTKMARLGGYLARAQDAPPGNLVIWRGLVRLTDIALGFQLGAQLVGN